jgi:hypothetical protein
MGRREIILERVDWICLTYDRDQWWVRLNTVMNLHKRQGIS